MNYTQNALHFRLRALSCPLQPLPDITSKLSNFDVSFQFTTTPKITASLIPRTTPSHSSRPQMYTTCKPSLFGWRIHIYAAYHSQSAWCCTHLLLDPHLSNIWRFYRRPPICSTPSHAQQITDLIHPQFNLLWLGLSTFLWTSTIQTRLLCTTSRRTHGTVIAFLSLMESPKIPTSPKPWVPSSIPSNSPTPPCLPIH